MAMIDDFIRDGYVRLADAFPGDVAAECRRLLWEQIEESPDDPSTWRRPVVRLGYQSGGPFQAALNTPRLTTAYDALVGTGRWLPREDLGTFPIRFPSPEPPGDDGWHIDASFPPLPGDDQSAFAWRVNLASRGRALLLLVLLSDVDDADAPTRIRVGSHRDVAGILAPYGDDGLTMREVSQRAAEATAGHRVVQATGRAGDVYLCHPFLVHAAQAHHGTTPRFLAQPPLHPRGWIEGSFDIATDASPVARAIREALAGRPADEDLGAPGERC